MIPLLFKYKVLWLSFSKASAIPTSWSELSKAQLMAISTEYATPKEEIDFYCGLLNIPKHIAKNLDEYYKYQIIRELVFLTEFTPLDYFIIPSLKTLSAPKARLEGMSFGQFMFVDSYFESYVTKNNDESLDKFVASLYLPSAHVFNTIYISAWTLFVHTHFTTKEKMAIAMNYRLVKEWLGEHYPIVFLKKEDNPSFSPERISSIKNNNSWIAIFESIVGDDIVNQDRYAQLPLHIVLKYLTTKIKENVRR